MTGFDLLRNSGEPRPRAPRRAEVVMTVLSMWFVLGLYLDAHSHVTHPELESFVTPAHAVFYSGFSATAGWVLWMIHRKIAQGRRGLAAVPMGYGLAVVALPVFAVSGAGTSSGTPCSGSRRRSTSSSARATSGSSRGCSSS